MKHSKMPDKDISLPDVLNAFYARFKQNASGAVSPDPTAPDTSVPTITAADIRSVFLGVNPRKAMGPDGIPGQALRSCVDQLAKKGEHVPIYINEAEVERVESIMYLEGLITETCPGLPTVWPFCLFHSIPKNYCKMEIMNNMPKYL
eukprot:g37357.t1